jgi:TonB family protein
LGARTALGAPLALSLAGHAAVVAVLAGVWFVAGSPVNTEAERVIPVRRAVADPGTDARRLRVDFSDSASGAPSAGPDDAAVALDTTDPLYRPYLIGVKQRIWERWSAPAITGGKVAQGSLVVEFTLTRRGRLAAAGVLETSGIAALDRAALAAVEGAVPFAPLPASIPGESMRVRARFVYD